MNFHFSFDNSRKICYNSFSGSLSYDDLELSFRYLIHNKFLPETAKGILIDYRDTQIQSPIDIAQKLLSFLTGNHEVFNQKRIAFVSSTPDQVLIPMLMGESASSFESRPFSTIEAAENWLIT